MSDDPVGPVISGKLSARYRLLGELGRGAMGVVHRAEQLDDRGRAVRQVAIKMIRADVRGARDDLTRRFRREIAAAIALRSRHTVTVYEFGETADGDLYYVMELVDGPTLRQILDRHAPLSLAQVAEVGRQICDALEEAHHLAKPVVHRDLKPGNVLVERWEERVWVKVGDFGIAKTFGDRTTSATATLGSLGTPRYMAPEQCRGQPLDGRADLYSLGVILYECLTGHTPFSGDQMALMFQHVHQPPPPLPQSVPAPMRAIIERLLAKDPAGRPPSAGEVRRSIEAVLQEVAVGKDSTPPERQRRDAAPDDSSARGLVAAPPRTRWGWGGAALALGGVLALAMVAAGGRWIPWLSRVTTGEVEVSGKDARIPVAEAGSAPAAARGHSDRTMIAVLAFRNERDADREHNWIGTALQASFTTELNKVREVRVVSRERVNEVAPSAASALAAVRSLGAQKLLAGSFAVHRDQIRVDVWLVDADSGIQEMAETVEGGLDEFFGLQKRVALAMLEHLPVAVKQGERQAIAAKNKSENPGAALDAYRLMLQTEGLYGEEADEENGEAGGPQTRLAPTGRPVGALSRLLGLLSSWPSPASAQEPTEAEDTIRQVLEDYRLALEKGDLDGISRAKGQLSQGRRKGLEEYYKIAESLRVEFESVEIAPIDDRHFAVSYRRRDEFADRRTGEKVSLEVHLENLAVLDGDQWRLSDKKPADAGRE